MVVADEVNLHKVEESIVLEKVGEEAKEELKRRAQNL